MKHKTFVKENDKKLKLIIKSQKEKIRLLETEIKALKKELDSPGKATKEKTIKELKPKKEVKQVSKQVLNLQKDKKKLSDEERIKFCKEFSARFKSTKGSEDDS